MDLTEKEAYQRVRADRLDGLLASVAEKENQLMSGTGDLISALEALAKQVGTRARSTITQSHCFELPQVSRTWQEYQGLKSPVWEVHTEVINVEEG